MRSALVLLLGAACASPRLTSYDCGNAQRFEISSTEGTSPEHPRLTVATAFGYRETLTVLFHEMLHATERKDGHCLWSTRYLEQFDAMEDLGTFYDECTGERCEGDDEGRNWACRPATSVEVAALLPATLP